MLVILPSINSELLLSLLQGLDSNILETKSGKNKNLCFFQEFLQPQAPLPVPSYFVVGLLSRRAANVNTCMCPCMRVYVYASYLHINTSALHYFFHVSYSSTAYVTGKLKGPKNVHYFVLSWYAVAS